MNVPLGVCVLFCLLACSVEGHVHQENFDNFFENIDGHEYGIQKIYSNLNVNSAPEQCHVKIHKDALKHMYHRSKCQPQDSVVKLVPTKGLSFFNDKVLVKRCHEIGCYGTNSCLPTATRVVRVAVRMRQSMAECGWINVTEHTKCKCGCPIKPEHCNKLQMYFANDCMCKCMNIELKNECISTNMTWDETTCTCKCNEEKVQCSTGTYWVPEMCKCMKMMMMDESYDKYQMIN